MRNVLMSAFTAAWILVHPAFAQQDVADIASQDFRIGGDPNKRYFLIGPKGNAKKPEPGYKLLIVLPGGAGTVDFHPFIKRISHNQQNSCFKNLSNDLFLFEQRRLPITLLLNGLRQFS